MLNHVLCQNIEEDIISSLITLFNSLTEINCLILKSMKAWLTERMIAEWFYKLNLMIWKEIRFFSAAGILLIKIAMEF